VPFCNTLVDRIVPGAPAPDEGARLQQVLGYTDGMLTTCETYRLFAIEGDEALRARLRFADADPGIVVTPDIAPYRERKVRLLNGTHTAFVPTAILCGFETVREAVEDPTLGAFVRRILFDEIAPTVEAPGTEAFAREVLDRFANPFIRHALIDITLQGTMKARVRNVPTIQRYAARFGQAPASLAFGFAAFLLFLRGDVHADRRARGLSVPADDQAERIRAAWADVRGKPSEGEVGALVDRVLSDAPLWDADLGAVPGFRDAVADYLARMLRDGVPAALRAHLAAATAAR
jgi:tagaturonate reductase